MDSPGLTVRLFHSYGNVEMTVIGPEVLALRSRIGFFSAWRTRWKLGICAWIVKGRMSLAQLGLMLEQLEPANSAHSAGVHTAS